MSKKTYITNKLFRHKALVSLISLATGTIANASIVSENTDYQYFRDFSENKGKFKVGATQIEITDKLGKTSQLFPDGKAGMLDLAVTSTEGIAHLVDPQYIASVKHNVGYSRVQFGLQRARGYEPNFNYLLVARNDHPDTTGTGRLTQKDDYHIPRLHKLVTEVAPIPILRLPENELHLLTDRKRFPYIIRTGSGMQMTRNAEGVDTSVAAPYVYTIGGNALNNVTYSASQHGIVIGEADRKKTVSESKYGPIPALAMGGDSGSPVFAFDAEKKQWFAVGVHHGGDRATRNHVLIHYPEVMDRIIAEDQITLTNDTANPHEWTQNGNTSTLMGQTVNLRDLTKVDDGETRFRNDLEHGKTIRITGQDGTLRIGGDVHQGAGALYFDTDFNVFASRANATWVGAGISVADGKTVDWKLHNPADDRLSKVGKGTLNISGSGENQGKISVGEGKVILNQQADNTGKKQAFSEVHITSGRGTVVLGDANQVNPNNIVFGFRGGRLDVNGNDLEFTRIRALDSGAKIVNLKDNDASRIVLRQEISTVIPLTLADVRVETNRTNEFQPQGIYANRHRDGHIDYFALKDGMPASSLLPSEKQVSNTAWQYLSSNLDEAKRMYLTIENAHRQSGQTQIFEGELGETDANLTNGQLDFVYRPQRNDARLVLNGRTNLNGNMAVEGGTLLLSGSPVLHAYDYINSQDVIKEDDWISHNFTATNFQISGGELATSRNVERITGDINANNTASVKLGFDNGTTEHCYRSDFTGKIYCNTQAIADKNINNLTVQGNINAQNEASVVLLNTNVSGRVNASQSAKITLKNNTQSQTIQLNDTATLTFANTGNALKSKVLGGRKSQVILNEQAHWQLPENTTIGHLDGKNGSQITLSDSQKANEFHQLTLNGDLTGNVQFNQRVHLGDGQGDKLNVHGYATGSHTLAVQNTGQEAKVDELTLVELKHAGQNDQDVVFNLKNGSVDVGALRYTLQNDPKHRYYLFNPEKANEIKQKRDEEARKAEEEAQKARQALTDAINAKTEAERKQKEAEDALKQALTNGGANAQDVANAQKLAEQALADKQKAENQLAEVREQLNQATTAKEQAETLKNQAQANLQTALDNATRLQTELNDANRAKETAEQAKKQADDARILAEQQAQTAQNEKAQAEQNLQTALTAQQKAESDKQDAQTALATAQAEKKALEQQLIDAQNAGNQDVAKLREQLNQANAQITAQEQALTQANLAKTQAEAQKAEAERQKNDAQTALNQAQQDLTEANRAKDDANNRATQAENQKQAVEQNLTTVQAQLTQAQADKQTAEQKARDAEIAKNNAEQAKQALEQAQTAQAEALKNAQEALKVAESQKQASDLAKQQAEDEKNRQAELARQADLAKQQAETAQKLAEDAKNQALTDLANAEQAKAQAELAKTQAENAQKLADTAREHAEKALQTALTDKQTAETAKTKAESDLTTALREKQLAEDALKLAQQNGNQDVVNLQNQLAQANQAVKDKELALANAETAKQQAEDAQKLAESQRDNALKSAETAEHAKAQAETTLADVRHRLALAEQAQAQAERDKLQAQAEKQASDLAKQQAENAQKLAEAEQVRQAELAKTAETAQKVAELNAQNAQKVQKLAEDAQAQAETARQKAEEANLALTQANQRLQAIANADAQTIAQAKTDLANAQKLADERNQALVLAQNDLTAKQAELNQIRQQNSVIEAQLQQEQSLRKQAEIAQQDAQNAQKLAEQAKLDAIQAQTKSDAEKQQAEAKLAEAEKLAQEKQAEADKAEQARADVAKQLEQALAQVQTQASKLAKAEADSELAKAQAKEAEQQQKLAEAEAARLKTLAAQKQAEELAKQASQKKQAEIISQYANTALSEVSAQAHHLQRVGDRIDDRLQRLNGQNSGVWLQTDAEKTKHSSDQYRGYEQNSQLTQIGVDNTMALGTSDLTLGASFNHLRYDADYDDDFTGKGQTNTGTIYGKWQHESGFAITSDVSAGQASSEIKQSQNQSDIKRNVASVGMGISQTFDAGGVDIQAHTGVKYHHLGDAQYGITASDNTQAQVKQDKIGITSYQAGVNAGKTIQTANGLNIRPSVGVNYRHTNSEAKIAINDQALTQKFANEVQGQVGVMVGKGNFEVKVQADYAKNNEAGNRASALVGVNWKF